MMKLSRIRSGVSGQFCYNYPDVLRLPSKRLWGGLVSVFCVSFILLIATGSLLFGGNPKASRPASACLCDDVRLYVTSTGAGDKDGSSWANAYKGLADAIVGATYIPCATEIWVAAGTYKPEYNALYQEPESDEARQKTFYLFDGLKIYGGFAGGEATLDERDVKGNPTILSGDIGAADDPSDNCYHVVLAAGTGTKGVTIDGFTVTGGKANNALDGKPTVGGKTIDWGSGGGIYIDNAGNNVVKNNSVVANISLGGGGIAIMKGNSTISNNSVWNNSLSSDNPFSFGGGLLIVEGIHAVYNNLFFENTAGAAGGGIAQFGGTGSFINNTFYKNSASGLGGGGIFFSGDESSYKLTNNIFWANLGTSTADDPGADYFLNETTVLFKNNILQLEESEYKADNFNALGDGPTGNIFQQDPMFVNVSDPEGNGLSVTCGPAIHAGTTGENVPLTDISGKTRGSVPTIGAYEVETGERLYVDQTKDGDGSSWGTAMSDLSDALEKARTFCNEEIWVAKGTYNPTMNAPGDETDSPRNFTFFLHDGLKIYGGFEGDETTLDERDVKANATTLNGGDNSYHVVLAASTGTKGVTIDGFTVTGGNANSTSTDSKPVVNTKEVNWKKGGGIYLDNAGNNVLTNNVIKNNSAEQGGGVLIAGGSSTISNNLIKVNSCLDMGISAYGGGMSIQDGTHIVYNNIIFGNTSEGGGGGVIQAAGSGTFINNTFYKNQNTVEQYGAGMVLSGEEGSYILTNNIFWGNEISGLESAPTEDFYVNADATAVFKNNILQLAESEYKAENFNALGDGPTGNLFAQDPMFVNTEYPYGFPSDDFAAPFFIDESNGLRVRCGSPALSAGITGEDIPLKDILGDTRGPSPTLGAYEKPETLVTQSDFTVTLVQSGTVVYGDCDDGLIASVTSGVTNGAAGNVTAKVWVESSQPTKYVARHFEIKPETNAATATATVTLYFSNDDFKNFNNQEPEPSKLLPEIGRGSWTSSDLVVIARNIIIEKRSGEGGTYGLPTAYTEGSQNITPTSVLWNEGMERWEVTFPVTGFSGFFLKTIESALPVRWISFSGSLNGEGQSALTWKVDEQGVDHYEVLRSTDAVHFQPLSRVPAQGDGLKSYVYTDVSPVAGTAYYRIKEIDVDGTFSYSRIINLNDEKEVKFSTYPNPTKKEVVITVDKKYIGTRMTIINTAGVEIQHFKVDAETFTADLSRHPSGIYLLRTNDGKSFKLAKE